MDAIANLLLFGTERDDVIVLHNTMMAVLKIDAEEGIIDIVANNAHMLAIIDFDATWIFERSDSGMLNFKSGQQHMIRFDRNNFIFFFAIQRRPVDADEGNRFVNDDVPFCIITPIDDNRIAIGGSS